MLRRDSYKRQIVFMNSQSKKSQSLIENVQGKKIQFIWYSKFWWFIISLLYIYDIPGK